jgi:hypothetical protein
MCGFVYAWNGASCEHCLFPSSGRRTWRQTDQLTRLQAASGNPPPEKLLLFSVGCLRRAWDLFPSDGHRRLVGSLEEWVTGESVRDSTDTGLRELLAGAVEQPFASAPSTNPTRWLVSALRVSAELTRDGVQNALELARDAASCLRHAVGYVRYPTRELLTFELPPDLERYRASLAVMTPTEYRELRFRENAERPEARAYQALMRAATVYNQNRAEVRRAEEAAQCELFRDVLPYPFEPVALAPDWRTSTVMALARQFYDSRDFSPMPILADALQDAGCDDPDILDHCRADKPHVRGCWAVDLVLGN